MNSDNNINASASEQSPMQPTVDAWKGYGVDELRYRRALTLVRLESQKALLAQRFRLQNKSQNKLSSGGILGLIRTISSKLTVFDYILLGLNVSKLLLKFRKKRR
ncbi:MAG: hypothetical protein ACI4AH_05735 [Muribaculaceae bacterium]